MIELETFETIKSRLKKLDAIIACPGATEGEKANARRMREALLERYDLSEADVTTRTALPIVFPLEKARWGKQLFLQCAAWMLQVSPVPVRRSARGTMCMDLTPLDAADLRACYGYYVREMRIRERAIADTVKKSRTSAAELMKECRRNQRAQEKQCAEEKAGLLDALILRYELRGPRHGEPTARKVSEAEFIAFLKRQASAKQFKSDAWQRGEKLDNDEPFRLTA